MCFCLMPLHVSEGAREGLEVLPQLVTPSQAGTLLWGELREKAPHQTMADWALGAGTCFPASSAPGELSCKDEHQG